MQRAMATIVLAGLLAGSCGSIFNFSAVPITGGDAVPLAQYAGNVSIVVNVATY